ncbi:MAG: hypothetical protein KDJ38_12585 [Gammaproteobacteria bacterium]|nr:hypothetical protein [Gammaproteobacteria bacterium]
MPLFPVRFVLLAFLLWFFGAVVGVAFADQAAKGGDSTGQTPPVTVEAAELPEEQEITRLAMHDPESLRPTEKTVIEEHAPILVVPLVLVVLALVAVSRRKEQEK